jgi:imidazole glycerol-phosphate synthase subunit HisF
MLKKRIIPCLDIKDGRVVKGVNFLGLKDAGDPVELSKRYILEGADELVFLDITATMEKRKTLAQLVEKIAAEINIPFTVGGGINTVEDARAIINAGADKISVNSSAVKNPQLIADLADEFGSQCVVVAVDVKKIENEWMVFVSGGKIPTGIGAMEWIKQAEQFGAGEILLTSMNSDGTKEGFEIEITELVSKSINIPVIASGGAGEMEHFKDVFEKTDASAALAASVFHYGQISVSDLKDYLRTNNITVR